MKDQKSWKEELDQELEKSLIDGEKQENKDLCEDITKSTKIFQITFLKLVSKYPKFMNSSISLSFLKKYFKNIKEISKENSIEFKSIDL